MLKGAVAKRYAQAAFEIAQETNGVDAWLEDLSTMRDVFHDQAVAAFLSDAKTRFEAKKDVLTKSVKAKDPLSLNLAYLLIARGRLDIIDQLVVEFERLVNGYRGIEVVAVKTAVPLDDSERKLLEQRLASYTGKQIILETAVDEDIMGGLIARIGDKVIDGSTRTKLLSLKQRLASAG